MDRETFKHAQIDATAQNALAAAQRAALATEERRRRAMMCAWGSVTAMALVATLGLAEGCAHDHTVATESSTSSAATQQAVVASTQGFGEGASSALPAPVGTVDGEHSLPPDLVAAVSDTFVTAGQPAAAIRSRWCATRSTTRGASTTACRSSRSRTGSACR